MRILSKSLFGIFLLTFTAGSWAACPEGFKNNYKGECIPKEGGIRDADVSGRENYDFECAEKTLGKRIIDQLSEGRRPSQDELDRIEHCRVDNNSTQRSSGSKQTGPQQSGERLTEANYNLGCVDATLGMQITDQLFYEGRRPSQDELDRIEHCSIKKQSAEYGDKQEQTAQPQSGERFDVDAYDFECANEVLGPETTDQLFFKGKPPTQNQLKDIERCMAGNISKSQSGKRFDVDAYDFECANEVLGPETTDQLFFKGKPPTQNQLKDIERCMARNISKRPPSGNDSDSPPSGDTPGPVRRIVNRSPLPKGVISAALKSVQLPNANRVEAKASGCEVFEGSYCAEVRWEPVSDLRAGSFTAIKIAPSDSDVIYAGVDSNDMSLYKSEDGGVTWRLAHITGHTSGVAVSPNDADLMVYSILEGPMQRTTDGGSSWNPVDTGDVVVQRLDPAKMGANLFTTVVFAPDNADIAYAATVSGMHRSGSDRGPVPVYVSRDGGAKWKLAGTCETCGGAKTMAVQPGDSNVVWAATNNGVQVSRDGGKTWSGNLIDRYTHRSESYGIALRPGDPNTILLASAESGMFRSTDGGATWTQANAGLGTQELHQVTFAASNSDVAYVATHEGVYRSDDAGQTWVSRSRGLQYLFSTPIAVDPRNEDIVFVGSSSEVYTTHPNHFNAGLHEGEGLYKSTDGGINWFRSDDGIDEAKLAQMGTHPLLPFYLWADGESGRGAFFTPDAGDSWLFAPNHASHYPMVFAFSRSFPTVIYLTSWMNDGELMVSTDGGYNWPDLTPQVAAGISEKTKSLGLYDEEKRRWLHLHGLAIAETDPNIIYVGSVHDTVYPDVDFNLKGSHIFKSTDGGKTFFEMSDGYPIETRTSINAIVVHPTDLNIVYAMTSLHESETAIGIYKTVDGAKTWSSANNGLDPYTNDLQIDPTEPDTLYAASESGIYKTTNGGNHWNRLSNGIPEKTPVIDLAIDPLNPLVLYAITPDHVYRTKNGGQNWYTVDLGLPLLAKQEIASAQSQLMAELQLDRTKTGHSVYGSTFAQDRTLEIDATGRVLYVVVKTKGSDMYGPEWSRVRRLYRAVLPPLIPVNYTFEVNSTPLAIRTISHIYDVVFDERNKELRFTAAGPKGLESETDINIPSSLFSPPYVVKIDNQEVPILSTSNSVSFGHYHIGKSQVVISGR
jgi:photosystem II stability/assembly factor-like uncharacterized protein